MVYRRSLLHTGWAAGVVASLPLPRLSRADVRSLPDRVALDPGIEPLVQQIEETRRQELIETLADRVRKGLPYRRLLAALFLAAVRNVQPRPSVGFKFHSVLVVNSAHLASLASPDTDRWLPIFWALDYFKSTQIEEERKSGWKLPPVDEGRVPSAHKARRLFEQAMDDWDAPAADAAVAGLCRSRGAAELFQLFCRYGARDYRSIGHKAIYVANSFRVLQTIGWHHAEPVLRSLTFALQNHSGEQNPRLSDHAADRPWRENLEREIEIPSNWQEGSLSSDATRDLVECLRTQNEQEVPAEAIERMQRGVSPRSLWDAVFLASGELLMQQPGIIGLHSLTTANALYFAYAQCGDDATRRMLLLQALAFVPMFRRSALQRGKVSEQTLDSLFDATSDTAPGSLEQVFTDVGKRPMDASRGVWNMLRRGDAAEDFLDEARRLVFIKGRDAHDYKFSSAILEDYYHVTPAWRNKFLALGVFNLKGIEDRDNQLVGRIRAALG